MKKIANLVFNPFINDSRVLKESMSLAKNGYYVEVIAHLDKDLAEEEKRESFIVKRFSYLDRRITKSVIGKFGAYSKYFIKSIVYCKSFDYLHCNDLITLPIGVFVKCFFKSNTKVVYDAHEYETEVKGLVGWKKKVVSFLERLLIKYADAVIVVSDSIANEYVRLYNIPKPYLVLNTPVFQKKSKKNLFREKLGIAEEKQIFLYQGGLGSGRGIEILIEAFKRLKGTNKVIVFMGYGDLESLVKNAAKSNSNIYYHPAVVPEVLLNYTSSADYGVLFYENNCLNHNYCSPNKMFEYTMAKLPVLISNLYEMKKMVEKYNIGLIAEENTVKGFMDAVEKSSYLDKDKLSENLDIVKGIYNWEEQEKELINLYKKI